MEFLWLGNMTLFICFVQSSLLLPTTSPFWNRAVHGSRQRNRMFLWHSHSKLCGFGENNRLIEEKAGALPALFQQVERFWLTADFIRNEPVFPPAVQELESSPSVTLTALINYLPSSRCQNWKWEVQYLESLQGLSCPATVLHTREGSQAYHYHILWALSQSFRHCTRLSVCHVNAPGWLRLVQLVAPTHTVISCKRAGQAVRGGKVNCDLSWWLRGRREQFKQGESWYLCKTKDVYKKAFMIWFFFCDSD